MSSRFTTLRCLLRFNNPRNAQPDSIQVFFMNIPLKSSFSTSVPSNDEANLLKGHKKESCSGKSSMGGICTRQDNVLNAREQKNATIHMIQAAACGNVAKLSSLLNSGIGVNSRDRVGRSALHLACAEGCTKAVQLLLRYDADVNSKDIHNHVPLFEAMINGHNGIVQILRKTSAGFEKEAEPDIIFKVHEFASLGKVVELKKLAAAGFPINIADAGGRTALDVATDHEQHDVIEFLRSSCSNNGQGLDSGIPLHNRFIPSAKSQAEAPLLETCGLSSTQHRSNAHTANFAVMEAFPPAIASALLHGRQLPPIDKPSVTLLYSDIAGFTTLSSTMPPHRVSRMLNHLFAKFDRLAHLHGVQKVDTVGDAYIAAANLFEHQPHDHAARLARFAIDMAAAAAETSLAAFAEPAAADADDADDRLPPRGRGRGASPRRFYPACSAADSDGGGGIPIRIGLHCGPVSGRVVTKEASRYTLFGDTVRVAAAMERSGQAGRIQCSADFARLVAAQAHDVALSPRAQSPPLHARSPAATEAEGDGGGGACFWLSSHRRSRRRSWSPEMDDACDDASGSGWRRPAVSPPKPPRGPRGASMESMRSDVSTDTEAAGCLRGGAVGLDGSEGGRPGMPEQFLRVGSMGLFRMRTQVFRL